MALGHAELRLSEDVQRDDPTRSRALVAEARDHLARSVELDERNPFALTQFGRSEGKLGHHSQARFAFERAVAVDAAFVDARFGLAVALLAEGELAAAKEQTLVVKAAGDARADALLSTIDERLAAQRPKSTTAATK